MPRPPTREAARNVKSGRCRRCPAVGRQARQLGAKRGCPGMVAEARGSADELESLRRNPEPVAQSVPSEPRHRGESGYGGWFSRVGAGSAACRLAGCPAELAQHLKQCPPGTMSAVTTRRLVSAGSSSSWASAWRKCSQRLVDGKRKKALQARGNRVFGPRSSVHVGNAPAVTVSANGNRPSIFDFSRNAYLVGDLGVEIHIGFRCPDADDQGVSCRPIVLSKRGAGPPPSQRGIYCDEFTARKICGSAPPDITVQRASVPCPRTNSPSRVRVIRIGSFLFCPCRGINPADECVNVFERAFDFESQTMRLIPIARANASRRRVGFDEVG